MKAALKNLSALPYSKCQTPTTHPNNRLKNTRPAKEPDKGSFEPV